MSEPAFLFDANVWVALAFAAHPNHARAVEAYHVATPSRPACFCRATQQSVLRLLSTPAILRAYGVSGLSNLDALATLGAMAAAPSTAYRDEPAGIVPIWHRLAGVPSASPKLWMDAYLAAFAITGTLRLVTFDQAFAQFQGLDLTVLTPVTP